MSKSPSEGVLTGLSVILCSFERQNGCTKDKKPFESIESLYTEQEMKMMRTAYKWLYTTCEARGWQVDLDVMAKIDPKHFEAVSHDG